MFYTTDLLSIRRRGKFSRVWLAATLSERMFKQICKPTTITRMNVSAVCAEILSTMERRGETSTKLSLSLSSKLMYGVTRILYYQVEHLQASVNKEYINLYSTRRSVDQERPVYLDNVPEPPPFVLPVPRDEHLITEMDLGDVGLMKEEMNFGVLTTEELERFLLHEGEESFMEIRGLNWDEQIRESVPERSAELPILGTNEIDVIQTETETGLAHGPRSQREFLLRVENGEVITSAPSTPRKRSLKSPTGTPSKRSRTDPVSVEKELIPEPVLAEPEPAPASVAEIIPEQQSGQGIGTSAIAPPRSSLEQQPIDSEQFYGIRTRKTVVDRQTTLDRMLMRRRMEDVTFQTRPRPGKIVPLPRMLSAQEHLKKPAMHKFGTNWGTTLLKFFRRRLTQSSMVPTNTDEFDIPGFDESITEQVARADETSRGQAQPVELTHLTRLETTDQSRRLERTIPLFEAERELADQTAGQLQAESLVQIPEVTVHEEKSEEAVVVVQETFVKSSPVLGKQDLFAQIEVLLNSNDVIDFHELLPHNCTRVVVACAFTLCLELHKEKAIVLKQEDPYGKIWIERYVVYNDSESSTTMSA